MSALGIDDFEFSNLHVYRSGGIYDEENTHEKTYGNLYDIK